MTEVWTPLCLVADCDRGLADWPMAVVVVTQDLTLRQDDAVVDIATCHPQLALAISLSPQGAALLDRLDSAMSAENRSLTGLRHDLTSADTLASVVAGALSAALVQSQSRVVRQQRELSQMRQMTERSLRDFEKLEAFVWQIGKGERNPTLCLIRGEGSGLALTGVVEQRLPGDSVGLSDVAVWIEGAAKGRLTARLVLSESAQTMAEWQIDDPAPGWLRLALPRALGSDAQTPFLHLSWQGEPQALGQSLDHPDPRFQCRGGPVLAIRLWKFIPGATAPLTPDAHAPGPQQGRWLIGLSALAEAAEGAAQIDFVDWAGGLAFRPKPGQTLTLPLPGMARKGMRHLQTFVAVEGGGADVALAVPGQAPIWQTLTAAEPGQLHAALPMLTGAQDLLLIVRAHADAAPMVVFERIEAFAVPMGQDA